MRMIFVGEKPRTERVAVARALIVMQGETAARIAKGQVEKGDVLAAARLAGILAAKHTPDIVPLCHPIALAGVEMEVKVVPRGVLAEATVRTVDRTGVEMEALTAVTAACLTVYDMLKRYERGMRIEAIELIEKRGGRSGHWLRPREAPADPPARMPARSRRIPGGPPPRRALPERAGPRRAAARAGRRR